MYKYSSRSKAYLSLLDNWNEPFGLSVAEAIACGTPIIATKCGSMNELVKDGVSGILVNSVDEAVSRMEEIESIDYRKCREFGYKMFSVDKMVDGYLDVYNKLLG